jgi:hypothetical protein
MFCRLRKSEIGEGRFGPKDMITVDNRNGGTAFAKSWIALLRTTGDEGVSMPSWQVGAKEAVVFPSACQAGIAHVPSIPDS